MIGLVGMAAGLALLGVGFLLGGSLAGPISLAAASLGVKKTISLIGNPKTALATIIALYIWQFGSSMLIFLAGLKNIPESFYEAAVVDGAGSLVKFFRITLPLLDHQPSGKGPLWSKPQFRLAQVDHVAGP